MRPLTNAKAEHAPMNARKPRRNHSYDIVDSAQSGAAIELIARVFSQDEPLAVTVGQSRDEFAAMLGVFLPAALPEGLTMGAFGDGEMVGIALTTSFTFSPPPEIEGTSPNYPPIGALIEALERNYEQENAARLDHCAHIHMLAIDRAVRGRGIAQKLVEATAINARAKGFDAVVTDATNPISRRVFARDGFAVLNEVRYDGFRFDGRAVFGDLAGQGGIALMEKHL